MPLTGLDVPDAEGVPLGAQSRPQPVLEDDVVDVVVLEVGAPAAAEDEVVVVELDAGGEVAVPEVVEVLEVVLDVLWFVEVTVPVAEPEPVPVVCPLPELAPQPAVTRTRTSAATTSDTKRIGVEPLGFTAGPRALRARA